MPTKKEYEVIKTLTESGLREEDYFDSPVFYYLAGAFPDLSIGQCVKIVDIMRQKFVDSL